MKSCAIPLCPAIVTGRSTTCAIHRHARLAKELSISQRTDGKGGARCLSCRRIFKGADWVEKEPERITRKDKTLAHGYRHVACEPPSPRVSKRAIREAERPLLIAAEAER